MDHEVGGVGFYHVGGGRGADDVGLVRLVWEEEGLGGSGTRSAPEEGCQCRVRGVDAFMCIGT